ncbi:MAG: glycosyltransferase family 2 protein [Planctomycetota bacterium]
MTPSTTRPNAGDPAAGDPVAPAPALSVVIPAYNEAARLPAFLDSVLAWARASGRAVEVLVVDDGSSDGTAEVARARAAAGDVLRVLRCPTNRGKGAAVRAGLTRARGARRLFVDADGATAIHELEALERALDAGADLAIGSREGGGTLIEASALRRFLGRWFNRAVRMGTVRGLRDTQCGFKLFNERALALVPLLREDGFAFDVELLLLAQTRGLSVAEVPVNWREVPGSKVHLARDGVRMLQAVRRIKARFVGGDYARAEVNEVPCDEL